MTTQKPSLLMDRSLTAAELLRLSPAERDAILVVAASRAQRDYCEDAELTAFDAFGEEDLRGQSANTASGPG